MTRPSMLFERTALSFSCKVRMDYHRHNGSLTKCTTTSSVSLGKEKIAGKVLLTVIHAWGFLPLGIALGGGLSPRLWQWL